MPCIEAGMIFSLVFPAKTMLVFQMHIALFLKHTISFAFFIFEYLPFSVIFSATLHFSGLVTGRYKPGCISAVRRVTVYKLFCRFQNYVLRPDTRTDCQCRQETIQCDGV